MTSDRMRAWWAAVTAAAVAVSCSASETESVSVSAQPVAALSTTEPATTSSTMATTTTTTPTTTTVSTTSTTMLVREPITVGFAGDTAFVSGLDRRDPFAHVVDLLSEPDLMVVNLETAVADPGVGSPFVRKRFLFRSPPESLQLLVDAGIDVVALGNNHSLDFGPEALHQTLDELDAIGLESVGAGVDESAAYEGLVLDVGEWKIGLVSLSRVPCDWSASGENVRPQVAWACPPFLDRADTAVVDIVAEADVTMVMIHGGREGVLCPSDFMVELEQRLADLGADVVIGGHPHVLQGITSWDSTLVVRSTGNFAFPSARGITANSAVFLVDVSENGLTLRAEPLRAHGGVLTVPNEHQSATILDQMNRVSAGWRFDEGGVAVEDPEVVGAC